MNTSLYIIACVLVAECACSSLVRNREEAEKDEPHAIPQPDEGNWSKITERSSLLISFSQELPDLSYEIQHEEFSIDQRVPLKLHSEDSEIKMNNGEQEVEFETTLISPIGIEEEYPLADNLPYHHSPWGFDGLGMDEKLYDQENLANPHEALEILPETDPKIHESKDDDQFEQSENIHNEGQNWNPEMNLLSRDSDKDQIEEEKLPNLTESYRNIEREKRDANDSEDADLDVSNYDSPISFLANNRKNDDTKESASKRKDKKESPRNIQVVNSQPKTKNSKKDDEVDPFVDWDSTEKNGGGSGSPGDDDKDDVGSAEEYLTSFLSGLLSFYMRCRSWYTQAQDYWNSFMG